MADLESAAGSSARPISDIDVDLEAEGLFDWDFEATPSEEIKGMRALIPLILPTLFPQECHDWVAKYGHKLTKDLPAYRLFCWMQLANLRLTPHPERCPQLDNPMAYLLQSFWFMLSEEERAEWRTFTSELCSLEDRTSRAVEWIITKLQYSSPMYIARKNNRRLREKIRRRAAPKDQSGQKKPVRGAGSRTQSRPSTSSSASGSSRLSHHQASHLSQPYALPMDDEGPRVRVNLPHWSTVALDFTLPSRPGMQAHSPPTGITSPHLYAYSIGLATLSSREGGQMTPYSQLAGRPLSFSSSQTRMWPS